MSNKPCGKCSDAIQCFPGINWNSDSKKFLFIINRPDGRVLNPGFFDDYTDAFSKVRTGQVLGKLMHYCSLNPDEVEITNIYKCLLPNDRNPTKQEYKNCLEVLNKQIVVFKPKRMIAFGESYKIMFPELAKTHSLDDKLGDVLGYLKIPTMISYHPGILEQRLTKYEKFKHYDAIRKFLTL